MELIIILAMGAFFVVVPLVAICVVVYAVSRKKDSDLAKPHKS
ncbi:MAG: hypothetical protein QGG36_20755 [Pirellulaceae bacterium]|nr:hypothetical protein [Pirellulaceae bacterium]MDP7018248.1 hypothetical protein [Pirellulaceae bacterium]